MCHENLKIDFDLAKNNCFFIGGCNGCKYHFFSRDHNFIEILYFKHKICTFLAGKSALFASLNLGLGGKGSSNDRGNSVKNYIKFGERFEIYRFFRLIILISCNHYFLFTSYCMTSYFLIYFYEEKYIHI